MNQVFSLMLLGAVLSMSTGCKKRAFNSNPNALFDVNAEPLPYDRDTSEVNWKIVLSTDDIAPRLSGVGFIDATKCTAFLIDSGTDDKVSPAYVITNGHCAFSEGLMDEGQVETNVVVDYAVQFKYFKDKLDVSLSTPVKKVLYATMTKMDVAVLELGVSQWDLEQQGIQTLQLSDDSDLKSTDALENPSIPVLGTEEVNLHLSPCLSEGRAKVQEHHWTWENMIRNKCSILGGSSGSPLLLAGTRKVVGLMNTGYMANATDDPCSLYQPCEISSKGTKSLKKKNYAVPVSSFNGCFAQGKFDLAQKNCNLTKKNSIVR